MQLRFPGTGEACKDRPDYNRETYFPAWAVPEESGRISLYLQEQLSGECDIQDISRLPGVPKLQPNGVPVRVEILLQQEDRFPDMKIRLCSELVFSPQMGRKQAVIKTSTCNLRDIVNRTLPESQWKFLIFTNDSLATLGIRM